ncbi:MAG: GxxExxY protein [Deltaproteobacteria bacterium]|nr:GxxExxY protein [Deltaproteobacteria bacterium]MBI3386220.1 GxxExxY protein [Deltaproteobacteria bacterium]
MTETADERRSLDGLTERIIGCAYAVANGLGFGFLEKVYENALAHDLRKNGIQVDQQWPLQVRYDGAVVGEYVADLLVEGIVVVELKVAKVLDAIHVAQCLNYLKATSLHVALLINFGAPRVEVKRIMNQF